MATSYEVRKISRRLDFAGRWKAKVSKMAGFELGDGVRKVFLAGIGAIAATAEKGQKLVNDLVDKGELTVDQGKSLNSELAHRVKEKTGVVRDAALEGRMKLMSDEERAEFVRKVNEFAHGAAARPAEAADGSAAADSKETAEQR